MKEKTGKKPASSTTTLVNAEPVEAVQTPCTNNASSAVSGVRTQLDAISNKYQVHGTHSTRVMDDATPPWLRTKVRSTNGCDVLKSSLPAAVARGLLQPWVLSSRQGHYYD